MKELFRGLQLSVNSCLPWYTKTDNDRKLMASLDFFQRIPDALLSNGRKLVLEKFFGIEWFGFGDTVLASVTIVACIVQAQGLP